MKTVIRIFIVVVTLIIVSDLPAAAHCDTLDGPVVSAARRALDSGDVTAVLKWVQPEHEKDIREAFARARRVRARGADAKDLADMYFFETVVRIHRAGEGFAFTGLKPAGTAMEPGIAAADSALKEGDVGALAGSISLKIANDIRERFAQVQRTRQHADDSVAAGREYVRAYVSFIHYIERLHQLGNTNEEHGTKIAQSHAD